MGPPFRKKPEVDMRVYTKAVDVASGSPLSSCVESADPAAAFARGCPSALMGV